MRRDFYLGRLLTQAEADAAACDPPLPYVEATVREHLLYAANGCPVRDDQREHDALRDRLLAVMRRVADEWSLVFDHSYAANQQLTKAMTPPGASKTVDALRARGRGSRITQGPVRR